MKNAGFRTGFFAFSVLACTLLLSACAHTNKAPTALTDVPVTAPAPEHQYSCVAKIYLSELTKAYILPADDSGEGNVISAGDVLDKMVSDRFGVDANVRGRVMPNVTLGFDRGTGVYKNPDEKGNLVQIRLQYQIFKPTGQSFSSSSFGQSPIRNTDQANTSKAITKAMAQALDRLGDGLIQTGICKNIL